MQLLERLRSAVGAPVPPGARDASDDEVEALVLAEATIALRSALSQISKCTSQASTAWTPDERRFLQAEARS